MKKLIIVFIAFILVHVHLPAQSPSINFFNLHPEFLDTAIKTKRFKHRDLEVLIQNLNTHKLFEVKKAGSSVLGKPIYLIRAGSGAKKVLLWSQMHGDESTATMALLDIFNYLKKEDGKQGFVTHLLEECTLYFIPMLNPDGAELFVRRNAQQIDINRDAIFLQSPEARVLKSVRDSLKPDFGFNLHDQSKYYTAGEKRPASISLLAPAYNVEKEVNEIRSRSMLLIAKLQLYLQNIIPHGVGRYDDEFEPRAFGDNIQKWGTSTILIETGAYENDPEKQFLRKVNFAAILFCLQSIADNSYYQNDIKDYWAIPENKTRLNDFIIRNIILEENNQSYRSDISFNISEFSNRATIADMGDLSVFRGYKEWDGSGKKLVPGKVYPIIIKNPKQLKKLNQAELLLQGYTDLHIKKLPATPLPGSQVLNLISVADTKNNKVLLGSNPTALIYEDGKVVARLNNGIIIPIQP